MIGEALQYLRNWNVWDWWIVVTGALAAMACAIPGCFLVVRKQSMMGDAISHSALPGIVLALLFANWMRDLGLIGTETYAAWRHAMLFAGAIVIGVFCAVATELVQKLGRVDRSAALGVVFTSLFALGLLLLRTMADEVDLDPECVLYGTLENVIFDVGGPWSIPPAVLVNGGMLLFNAILFAAFFKEFRISAFDPALATSMGINAHVMHYVLMVATAVTLVAAFESVGSILVIAMLIVPPATAHLLTDRLGRMVILSVLIAALSALFGHALALVVPPMMFERLGHPEVRDASTAGMMAAATGAIFVAAMLVSPRYGLVTRTIRQTSLAWRVAAEDVVGLLYRLEERSAEARAARTAGLRAALDMSAIQLRSALWYLRWRRWIHYSADGWRLTAAGRQSAQQLVRSHRLWESFIARHYPGEEHLHESAERVEHFLDERLREQLADELDSPAVDPHGAAIPSEKN
jgi:manganese/zinc/iron transport system permease protein